MEYYFYILVVVALFLKLGLYFCWYHMRRRQARAREVHIVMPDGTTRRAVVTGRTMQRNRREDRQILAQADALQHGENQGFEERPAFPHIMTGSAPVGAFPEPPPYPGIIGSGLGSTNEWKLPKYEDLPPPYDTTPTEMGCSASEVVSVPMPSPSSHLPATNCPSPSHLATPTSTLATLGEQQPLQQIPPQHVIPDLPSTQCTSSNERADYPST